MKNSSSGLTTIKATERGECIIPLHLLMHEDGNLRLLQFAQNRGLLEVHHRGNTLALRIGGIVGRLPITETLALDIGPKFPITNLTHMTTRACLPLGRKAPVERTYQEIASSEHSPEILLRSYAHYLIQLISTGVQREYVQRTGGTTPRPRLNIGQTQKKFWSRGKVTSAVVTDFHLTADLPVNRLLKQAAARALTLGRTIGLEYGELAIFREAIRTLERADTTNFHWHTFDVEAELETIPHFRNSYSYAIPIALALLRGSSVLYEEGRDDIQLPSYLVKMDDIFEAYVRNTLAQFLKIGQDEISIRDGNQARWSRPLLRGNKEFKIKPDVVFLDRHNRAVAIADAKYKPKRKEEDRYQVISHALSYRAPTAILIYPLNDSEPAGLRHLGSIGSDESTIDLFEYHFDLEGDLSAGESLFCSSLLDCVAQNIR